MISTHLPPQLPVSSTRPTIQDQTPSPQQLGDATLSRISDIANDVEMRDEYPYGVRRMYLVLDTNVLIDNLNVLRSFSEDLDKTSLPMKIIVPGAVLSELDGLKNRQGLSWFARTASTMLLQKIQEKKSWKVQARTETLNTKPREHELDQKQDIAIYDCCLYFKTKGEVVLLSNDTNLRTLCENERHRIGTVAPGKRRWTSRDLAFALFGDHLDLSPFRGQESLPKYRPARSSHAKHLATTEAPMTDDDHDGMEIDDDSAPQGEVDDYVPSHALDALHIQIIDHFSIVFKELAFRLRKHAGDLGPPTRSQYAPDYRRKAFETWNVRNCLEYLQTKKTLKPSQPPLDVFLLRRNEDRGWRRGQDWPRQAWMNALDALDELGRIFDDSLVLLSLQELLPHVKEVFNTPLRPTGI